jgi:hypothetical protein
MYDVLMSCMGDLEHELKYRQRRRALPRADCDFMGRYLEWWHIKKRLTVDDDDNLKNYEGYTVSATGRHVCWLRL